MLEVRDLCCDRGDRRLFTGLSFTVAPGQALQVVGANGSGKSTLLRILAGLFTGCEGEVRWRLAAPPLYLGHRPGVSNDLTAAENLAWLARLRGRRLSRDALAEALAALGLSGYEDVRCGRLSEGQRKRVALGQFLVCGNDCWIMDEPFSAIDTRGVDMVQGWIRARLEGAGCVIFSSHQAVAMAAAPHVGVRTLELG